MKHFHSFAVVRLFVVGLLLSMQSCIYINSGDNAIPPRGVSTRDFSMTNFDQLEMGDAFRIHVRQGSTFRVSATGELNDLDDLDVFTERNGRLVIRYRNSWRNRRQRMDIDVTLPALRGVNFFGASESTIEGFENVRVFDYRLAGASKSSFTGSAEQLNLDLSGASELTLRGEGRYLDGNLTGASQLLGFDYRAEESDLGLSGASRARVWVTRFLKVDASGASNVRYKGSPSIEQRLSGGSSISRD